MVEFFNTMWSGIWTGGIGGSLKDFLKRHRHLTMTSRIGILKEYECAISPSTSFSGDGSGLTGLSSFSGDYDDDHQGHTNHPD